MAGSTEPEPQPDLGWKATVFGLAFALAVLGGFGAATAASTSDDHSDDPAVEGDGHDEDTGSEHDSGDADTTGHDADEDAETE